MFYLAQPGSLHSELKRLHTLVIYIVWLPVEPFTTQTLWPHGMFVFLSVKLHIFTAAAVAACLFLRNCLSRSVRPADVEAITQMICSREERLKTGHHGGGHVFE